MTGSGRGRAAGDARRNLPSVDQVLREAAVVALTSLYGRDVVRRCVRDQVETLRTGLLESDGPVSSEPLQEIVSRVTRTLSQSLGTPLRRVLNATGILLHTNLGRAPLPAEVATTLPSLVDAYCDLEMDLHSGRRSERNRRVEPLLSALTGAEAAIVVNNNAAALVLILSTLARDREVLVSRGELVEIGGSFRIPDIMRAAGVRLAEVGTTNRTRLGDYEQAVNSETALLLKVHPSNYRMSGFVSTVDAIALVALGKEKDIPVVIDEGSGLLRPHPASQLSDHPSMAELVQAGVDLVCGSGDKLLGGPQAGLIVGRREAVDQCRRSPLYRALRPDRVAYASLEAMLRVHLAQGPLPLDGLWPDEGEHLARLERVASVLGAEVIRTEAFLGGGAAPEAPIEGSALAIAGSDSILLRLRTGDPAVVGYLRDGRLILDLRTIDPRDDEALMAAVRQAQAGDD